MGDVISITDTNGEELVEYEYDEWGKTISVMEMNDNGKFFANTNPIRYRGYYYDNETGMYYLQSRYYDPELCRFISADSFNFIKSTSAISVNAYAYCGNNPLIFSDSTGCDFTWETVFGIIERCIVIDFVFPEFRYTPKKKSTVSKKKSTKSKKNSTVTKKKTTVSSKASTASKEITKWVSDAGAVIGIVITEIFTCWDLQEIAKKLKIDFDFTDFFGYLQKKVEIYTQYFKKIGYETDIKIAEIYDDIFTAFDLTENMPDSISSIMTLYPYIVNIKNDLSGRYITPIGSKFMLLFDCFIAGIIDIAGLVATSKSILSGAVVSKGLESFVSSLGTRDKAEFIAYNWYYLFFVDWSKL